MWKVGQHFLLSKLEPNQYGWQSLCETLSQTLQNTASRKPTKTSSLQAENYQTTSAVSKTLPGFQNSKQNSKSTNKVKSTSAILYFWINSVHGKQKAFFFGTGTCFDRLSVRSPGAEMGKSWIMQTCQGFSLTVRRDCELLRQSLFNFQPLQKGRDKQPRWQATQSELGLSEAVLNCTRQSLRNCWIASRKLLILVKIGTWFCRRAETPTTTCHLPDLFKIETGWCFNWKLKYSCTNEIHRIGAAASTTLVNQVWNIPHTVAPKNRREEGLASSKPNSFSQRFWNSRVTRVGCGCTSRTSGAETSFAPQSLLTSRIFFFLRLPFGQYGPVSQLSRSEESCTGPFNWGEAHCAGEKVKRKIGPFQWKSLWIKPNSKTTKGRGPPRQPGTPRPAPRCTGQRGKQPQQTRDFTNKSWYALTY